MDEKSNFIKYTRKKGYVFDISLLKDSRICNVLNVRAKLSVKRGVKIKTASFNVNPTNPEKASNEMFS